MDLNKELKRLIDILDLELKNYIKTDDKFEKTIVEAIEYSLFTGGKRIRPILCLKAYELFASDDYREAIPYALATEMIHTYSLIHDDLPAMDNDDYRRGKLTSHKKFGEAMAILAGDGLLNLAFELLLNNIKDEKDILASREIGKYSGIHGMVSGQVVDLHIENKSEESLLYMYKNKTAALIQAGIVAGSIRGCASKDEIALMREFGYNLGMAYQIKDDFLDLEEDEDIDKITYISVYGKEKAKRDLLEFGSKALKNLSELENRNIEFFEELIEKLEIRKF